MSKTSEKYIIERLERTENRLKWTEAKENNALEELRRTKEKLSILANMFEKTSSDDGKYSWYRVKGNFLIDVEKEAGKIITEVLEPEEEIPF